MEAMGNPIEDNCIILRKNPGYSDTSTCEQASKLKKYFEEEGFICKFKFIKDGMICVEFENSFYKELAIEHLSRFLGNTN